MICNLRSSISVRFATGPFTAVFVLGILMAAFGTRAALADEPLYTCGMHPQILKHEPGDCPICGMKLTPVRSNKATGSSLQIDGATVQRMNLKTAVVSTGPVRGQIRTVGTVAYNEEGVRDITLRYEGWLEKLYVKATWTPVAAGDALFEVYSPELYNAELNFVVARRSEGSAGGPLTESARARLQLLDLPESEIALIGSTLDVPRTRTFRAPEAGVVIEKMGLVGQMMKPGERIYRIADLSTVWVVAQINESDLGFVKEGQPVLVRATYGAAVEQAGKVDRLLPQVDEQTRTVAARIVLPNEGLALRPGMFTDVRFSVQLADKAVLVPELAVLRSGDMNTVFLAREGGFFEPREVRLGQRSEGGNYEVLEGLKEGDRIVTSGQFMLDSESQLREAIQKMLKAASSGEDVAAGPSAARLKSESPVPGAPSAVPPLYTCPMEEDAEVVSDTQGRCPKCNMKLVPTTEVEHGKRAEDTWFKTHPSTRAEAGKSSSLKQAQGPDSRAA